MSRAATAGAGRSLGRFSAPAVAHSWSARVAVITAAALAGRLALLGRLPLWRDEAFTDLVARRSLGGLLEAVRQDTNPPLSYLLAHASTTLGGGPVALRLVPALAGTAAVPIAALLGRRVDGERAGLLAAATVALMPAFVASSRDGRMYALATTLVMGLALAVWRAAELPGAGRLAWVSGLTALALHTHYLAGLACLGILCGAAVALRATPGALLRIVGAIAVGGLSLVPWLIAAPGQLGQVGLPFWILPLNHDELLGALTEFFCGPGVDPGTPHRDALQILQGGAIVGGAMLGIALLLALPGMARAARWGTGYLAVSGLLPIVMLLAISLRHPSFEARYVSVMWGPLAVLLGVGLGRLRLPPLRALGLGAMATTSVVLVLVLTRAEVPDLTAQLATRIGPGDTVVAPPADILLVLDAGPAAVSGRAHVIATEVPAFWGTAAYPPGTVIPALPGGSGRVFMVAEPGTAPPQLPAAWRQLEQDCHPLVCLSVYGP